MIDSTAGYEMLDVTGLGRFIRGNILREREGGARRALKYEDLLFLKEGQLQRMNWKWPNGTPPAKVQPPGRVLDRTVFENAVCDDRWRITHGDEYRDKNKEIQRILPVYDENNQARALDDFIGGEVSLEHISVGRALKLEKLEKAYENMGKLKRTWDGGISLRNEFKVFSRRKLREVDGLGREFTEPDRVIEEIGEGVHLIYESGRRIDEMPDREDEGQINPTMRWYEQAETRTWEWGSVEVINERYPYAVAAWLIGILEGGIEKENGNSEDYEDWIALGCRVEVEEEERLRRVRLGIDWSELAQETIERHGGEYVTAPNYSMKNQSVNFVAYGLLVEHGFTAT